MAGIRRGSGDVRRVRLRKRRRTLRARTSSADDVAEIIERAVLERWIDATLAGARNDLGPIWGLDHEAAVRELSELDSRWIEYSPAIIADECNGLRPRVAIGSFALIQREGEKRTRHLAIRELLGRTESAALRLRPCFMMSPLSVSQFLPSHLRFDVVIFDEASQISPSDAINCIARGKQLVIAGDQRQLPPTRFFEVLDDDVSGGDNQDTSLDTKDFESILDVYKASAALPSLPLRWHYRSFTRI